MISTGLKIQVQCDCGAELASISKWYRVECWDAYSSWHYYHNAYVGGTRYARRKCKSCGAKWLVRVKVRGDSVLSRERYPALPNWKLDWKTHLARTVSHRPLGVALAPSACGRYSSRR